jgi:hypothetical protein
LADSDGFLTSPLPPPKGGAEASPAASAFDDPLDVHHDGLENDGAENDVDPSLQPVVATAQPRTASVP